MTCDACTEKFNGKGGKAVHTNATKQLLIAVPPAVLILHLKRFQVGPRGMFRKITKHVTFPLVLDIAPFCASKVKRMPDFYIRPGQKQLPYSLYGIVEHSGTMHGGHYVAYVKVRHPFDVNDPRWHFVPRGVRAEFLNAAKAFEGGADDVDAVESDTSDTESFSDSECSTADSSNSPSDAEGACGSSAMPPPRAVPLPDPIPGKWFYVSDSRVQAVPEAEVLASQGYLLFYERIDVQTS